MARTAPYAPPPPRVAPAPAPPACPIADEAYRLAVCLLDDERAAVALLLAVVGALRPLRRRRVTPEVRAVVLRRLIAGARAARVDGTARRPGRRRGVPRAAGAPTAEREVLALALACDLDVGDAARVLRTDQTRVLALRRTAWRHVVAFGRTGAGARRRTRGPTGRCSRGPVRGGPAAPLPHHGRGDGRGRDGPHHGRRAGRAAPGAVRAGARRQRGVPAGVPALGAPGRRDGASGRTRWCSRPTTRWARQGGRAGGPPGRIPRHAPRPARGRVRRGPRPRPRRGGGRVRAHLRMALELRPSEPPLFDRVVLELAPSGRLGALGADDWERADDARLARPVAPGRPGRGADAPAPSAPRGACSCWHSAVPTRADRRVRASPPTPGWHRCWAALARGRVRTALYATVPPSHPT
jgi:hypothetical protein